MPTIIDHLILELDLDPKKFDAGLKKQAEAYLKLKQDAQSGGKDIEQSNKALDLSFGKIQNRVLSLAAIFMGGMGMKEFVSYVVGTDNALGNLSPQLHTSVSDLSAWSGVATKIGASAGTVTTSIQNLVNDLANFSLTGESKVVPVLRALKKENGDLAVAVTDSNNKLRNTTEILLDLSEWAHRQNDPARAAAVLRMLGFDQDGINLMLKGRDYLRASLDEMRKIGTVSQEDAEAARDLTAAWNKLERSSQSLGRSILTDLTPAIVTALGFLAKLFDELPKYRKFMLTPSQNRPGGGSLPWAPWSNGAPAGSTEPAGPRNGGIGKRSDAFGPQPASVRYNNPGAQYPSPQANAYGQTGYGVIGGGHLIARFPTPEHGAASNMSLLSKKYAGMTVGAAGAKWTGNNGFGVPGYDPNTVLTPAMTKDPEFMIPFMKAIAHREAGRDYPMTDAGWKRAFEMYKNGGAPKGTADGNRTLSPLRQNSRNAPWLPDPARGVPWLSKSFDETRNSTSSSVHINSLNINSPEKATDAYGIMREVGPTLSRSGDMGLANGISGGPN